MKQVETCPMHYRTPLVLDKDGYAIYCPICKEEIDQEEKSKIVKD